MNYLTFIVPSECYSRDRRVSTHDQMSNYVIALLYPICRQTEGVTTFGMRSWW